MERDCPVPGGREAFTTPGPESPGRTALFLGDTELRATGDGTGQPVVTGTRTYSALGQQLAVRVANLDSSGSSLNPPTQLYWLDNDNQGTTTTLIRTNTTSATASTTSNSAVTYRYSDPYGNPRGTATPPWPDSHGFLNQPTNADTGLVHLGARDYDPTIGRFLTVDPVFEPANPQQENGYSYARNNPGSESDPTGLIAEGDNGGTDCSNNQCVQAAEDTSRMNAVNAGLAPMSDQQMCDSECNFGTGSDFVGGLVTVVNDVRRVSPLAIVFKDPYDNQRLNKDFGWDPHSAMFNIGQTAPFVLGGPEGDTGEALAGLDGLDATGASIQTATKTAAEGGPAALDAPTRVSPWAGTSLSRVTQTEETMYRVWGGGSGQAGEWLTPIEPTSASAARQGLALPADNAALYVSRVTVPAGTRIQVGTAGAAFGEPGGWAEAQLLERIPIENFGKGVPLGP